MYVDLDEDNNENQLENGEINDWDPNSIKVGNDDQN